MRPGQNEMNKEHFDPMVAELLAPITEKPLKLEGVEALLVKELMEKAGFKDIPGTGFSSGKARAVRNSSDFQANIISSFASAVSPLGSLPPVELALRSFLWYRKLLAVSPIIIFLRQKQRLFSELTINQTNFPFEKLRSAVSSLSLEHAYSSSIEQRLHNYHLTNIATTDLLRLASLALNLPEKNWKRKEIWSGLQKPDSLCDKLLEAQRPHIVSLEDALDVELADITLARKYPLNKLRETLLRDDSPDVHSVFPYDVHYSDVFSLSIEHPVLRENHDQLLDILEKQSEIDIFAVRLNTKYPEIAEGLTKAIDSSTRGFRSHSMNYDQLLQLAEGSRGDKQKPSDETSMVSFIERLGKLGLVHVNEGIARDSIVLMG